MATEKQDINGSCCKLCKKRNPDKCWRRCLIDYLKAEEGQYVLCFNKDGVTDAQTMNQSTMSRHVTQQLTGYEGR